MTVKFEEIEELSTGFVRYFTIKLGEDDLTEFEKFDDKDFPLHLKEQETIYNIINEMQLRGAKEHYFVNEASAEYLPKVTRAIKDANRDDFGLRLYAKIVRHDVVVLFNGGIKTKLDPKDCDNVKDHFLRAIRIGLYLDKAFFNNDIEFGDKNPFKNLEIDV